MHPHRKLIKAYPKIRFNSFQRCNTLLRQPLRLHIFAFFPLWQNVLCGTARIIFIIQSFLSKLLTGQIKPPVPDYIITMIIPAGRKTPYTFPPKISWARKAVMEHCPKVGFPLVQLFSASAVHRYLHSRALTVRHTAVAGYGSPDILLLLPEHLHAPNPKIDSS